MSIEKLERVMWRLRKNHPKDGLNPTNHELRRSIIIEIGTNPRTYRDNRNALLVLEWIKPAGRKRIKLTNKDLTS